MKSTSKYFIKEYSLTALSFTNSIGQTIINNRNALLGMIGQEENPVRSSLIH